MRIYLIALFLPLLIVQALALAAEPVAYALDKERSLVGFSFDLGAENLRGNMPVESAEISLDLNDLSQSSARVRLDVGSAVTEAAFATEAMLGRQVLDAQNFPEIAFEAQAFTGDLSGGKVRGTVTIRGVTRAIVLEAQVFRQRGTAEDDLSRLSVLMTGTVDRRDFGASGFAQFVGPEIKLEILTRLTRK
ncbi:MAG: YceI family protein [Pseudomonadota bacterium]